MSNNYKALLALVRLGIGHSASDIPDEFEWSAVQTIANQHGLSAVVLDGIEKLPNNKRPPKDVALQWIGEVLHDYEQRYELYKKYKIRSMTTQSHGPKSSVYFGA